MQVHQPLVTLISVNFNQAEVTLDMIKSVLDNAYAQKQLILVDNGSKISPEPLLPKGENIHFIRSERNLGFSGGNNLALPHAKGKYLFFINNDTILTEGCIHTLVSYMEAHPKVVMASPLICFDLDQTKGIETIQYAGMTALHTVTGRNIQVGKLEPNAGQYQEPMPTAYAHGAAMMVRADAIKDIGIMDDQFFLYYEEMDWSARATKAGYDVMVVPQAKIYHKESLTVGEDSPLKTYFHTRNRIYFVRRNFPFLGKLVFLLFFLLFTLPKNLITLSLQGKKALVRAFWLGFWHHISPQSTNEFENLLAQAKA
jgi:GT2 family glycosyltransferase